VFALLGTIAETVLCITELFVTGYIALILEVCSAPVQLAFH